MIKHFAYTNANEASRKVANLSKRKNPHAPVYGVKEFVCLSVCLSVTHYLKKMSSLKKELFNSNKFQIQIYIQRFEKFEIWDFNLKQIKFYPAVVAWR